MQHLFVVRYQAKVGSVITKRKIMCYNFNQYRLATDLSPVRGALPTYPERALGGD